MQCKSAVFPVLAAILALGCPGNRTPAGPASVAKPHDGVPLKYSGSDPAALQAFADRADGWAARAGAKLELATADNADLLFVSPAELGALAERDELLPMPDTLKTLDHLCQWTGIFPVLRNRQAAWAGSIYGLPLAGDGLVLVVNADRFNDSALKEKYLAKFQRALPDMPGTWDDLAELAEACADLKRTAFPARSVADQKTCDDFFRIAACCDRPAYSDIDLDKAGPPVSLISFTHDAETGAPRLDRPGFAAAARLFARINSGRSANVDAVAALSKDEVAVAILNLAELAKLPKDAKSQVLAKFRVAPLPGARTAFDLNGKAIDFSRKPGGNYVPYYSGGFIGVVKKNCANPAAAFDLLADLASPARGLELLAVPAAGFGPTRRTEHLEQTAVWQRFGFDAAGTRALADALARNVGLATVNPAQALRGPDTTALQKALADALPDITKAQAAWQKLNNAETIPYRRHASGLP